MSSAQTPPPITSSGFNTQVSSPSTLPSGKVQYDITGGTRPGGGLNLFHSFGDFNVPNNNIANFLNSSGLATSNILGRVTGGNISNIFGVIQTQGFGSANLFLMNPAGFLFGPNATVNIGGMVSFTSADYLRLTDNARFNAVPGPADALLSAAPVAAFGFLGSNPGAITVQGSQLSVTPGESISLVGGDITVQSGVMDDGVTTQPLRLSAPGGQINLASLASPGELLFRTLQPAPNTNGQSFTAMGNISLSEGALLDVSADSAGTVRILGGQLVMDHATISADTAKASGAPVAIDINLTGDLSITSAAIPALTARTAGTGDAGEVRIVAQNVAMNATGFQDFSPFSVIDTHTSGAGTAGNVSITAMNNVALVGDPTSFVFAIDAGTIGSDGGRAGNVTLEAKNVVFEEAQVSTGNFVALYTFSDATGSGGNLKVDAETVTLNHSFLVTDSSSSGRAGDLTISAQEVEINNFGALSASGFVRGGRIHVNADHFLVDNSQIEAFAGTEGGGGIVFNGKVGEFTNGSTIHSGTGSTAAAGDITFTATEHLTFADSTDPNAFIIRPSGLFTTTVFEGGDGGTISVTTPVLHLSGGARFDATTRTSGRGGAINVTADTISISGERPLEIFEGPLFGLAESLASGIYSRTVQSRFCMGPCGDAGPITIKTSSLSLNQGGRIDSNTTSAGKGGNITVYANQISFAGTATDGVGSGIYTNSSASGSGGNVALTSSQSVTISESASISASTTGPGKAGNILVKASDISLTTGGTITAASTGAGNSGTVTIQGLNSPANSLSVDGTGSGIFTNTEDAGRGGSIFVNADTVTISNGGTLSAKTSGTAPSATGGTITVDAPNSLMMTNGAQITASSTGPGNTGDIQITAGDQLAMTNSTVTTEASQSGGGIIKITTNPNGTVQLTDSTITASVLDGTGGGGSVDIDPQFVILQNSQILANSVFGPGGNISITTNLLLPDTTSVISASSQFGQQGNIVIQSPVSPASGKIIPLGQKPLIATALVSQRCAALAGGSASSFTVAGRDSLPAEPSGWVSSPLALASAGVGDAMEPPPRTSRSEPIQEMPLLSLRRIAPPGFLTQNFAAYGTTGCTS